MLPETNRKCRPSGKNCGARWRVSSFEKSRFVRRDETPPSRRDAEDPVPDLPNQDRPVGAPCAPKVGVHMAQIGRFPLHVDDLELTGGHDRQEAAVRRPEGLPALAIPSIGRDSSESMRPDVNLPARHESHLLAIG